MTTAIKALFQRQIAYAPVIAKATGSVKLTVLWQQIHYWTDKTRDPEGWVYKTREQMFDETGLVRSEQETIRKLGKKLGVLESEIRGSVPMIHYRVNEDRMIEIIEKYLKQNPEKRQAKLIVTTTAEVVTPKEQTRTFFQDQDIQTKTIIFFAEQGVPSSIMEREIGKFVAYWTEPNSTGTKQRWEMEKTFEIKRRLVTWMQRVNDYSKKKNTAEPKGIRL